MTELENALAISKCVISVMGEHAGEGARQILVDMFEKLELGLIPKRDFDVDEKFFEEYKK